MVRRWGLANKWWEGEDLLLPVRVTNLNGRKEKREFGHSRGQIRREKRREGEDLSLPVREVKIFYYL